MAGASNIDDTLPSSILPVSRAEDQADAESVRNMYSNVDSKCCQNGCNKKIPKELAVIQRNCFAELSNEEQDLVILSHLQQNRQLQALLEHYPESNIRGRDFRKEGKTSTRLRTQYSFARMNICRKFFFFLHGDLGTTKYENLVKHYDQNGLVLRVHGNKNVPAKRSNVLTATDCENAVNFIKAYGDQFGYSLPGRMPQFKNFDPIKLPPDTTMYAVHNKYIESGMRAMDITTFRKIWKKYCPFVVITKPASDKPKPRGKKGRNGRK